MFRTYFVILAFLTITASIVIAVIKDDIKQLDRLRSIELEQEQKLIHHLMEFKTQLDLHEQSSHLDAGQNKEFSKDIIESTLDRKNALLESLHDLSLSWSQQNPTSPQYYIMKHILWDTKRRIMALTFDLEAELIALNAEEKEFYAQDMPFAIPAKGRISSDFGLRKHPISKRHKHHDGIDIANGMWTDIESTAKGKVVFSGKLRGYGNTVILDHGNGFQTLYAHAQDLRVTLGEYVAQGSVIAKMGSTGISTGPHVHYEVKFNGEKVNPERFITEVW